MSQPLKASCHLVFISSSLHCSRCSLLQQFFLSTESFVIGKDAAEGKSSGRVHLLFVQASRLSATLLPHLIRDLRKMLRCSLIVDESCDDFPSLCFYVCVE